ncbi:hypothetical protein MSAN_02021700 [Mycena sanguinolenta]|uniref:Uncharacterized protein n=1 Tax=Mycena sanguinolenta TaxID=230812 RepID=A0A8H6XKE4_9AGAR|nr:hypothetical protein MSAN_02021700 [Mycena sanguinolenta]
MGPPLLHLVLELLVAFYTSSLIVSALLRVSGSTFPLVETLEVTFSCTLVVFAALRGAEYFWNGNYSGSVQWAGEEGSESQEVAEKEQKFVDDLV